LAKELNAKIGGVEYKRFPDNECYVRILTDLTNETVILVQNSYPDEKIIELFLLQDAINEFNIRKLITVIPYYGYARQDKKFNDGEAVSARNLAGHLELDTDEIITVDIHAITILDWFDMPVSNVSAIPQIVEYLRTLDIDLVLSPDEGGMDRVSLAGKLLGCDHDYIVKTRIDSEIVKISTKSLDVSDKSVAIIDDIISTGGTITTVTKHLKIEGATKVYALCTHGLFVGNALEKLKVCDAVISTDTIENPTTKISVAKEIANAIYRR
jgi:ribose-phosphate pyrophosphokinase